MNREGTKGGELLPDTFGYSAEPHWRKLLVNPAHSHIVRVL